MVSTAPLDPGARGGSRGPLAEQPQAGGRDGASSAPGGAACPRSLELELERLGDWGPQAARATPLAASGPPTPLAAAPERPLGHRAVAGPGGEPQAQWWGPLDGPPCGECAPVAASGPPPARQAAACPGAAAPAPWWGPLDGPCPSVRAAAETAGPRPAPPCGAPSWGGPCGGGAAAELQEVRGLERRLAQLRADAARRDALLAVLPVEASAGEHDGFVEVPGMDALPPDQQCHEDGYSMPMMDLDACKRACAMDGPAAGVSFGAFVVHGGFVWFRPQPVGECRRNLVSSPGCTTFLNYGPEAARLCGRLRRGLARRRQLRAEAGALGGVEQASAAGSRPEQALGAADGGLRRKAALALQLQERVCGLEAQLQEEVEKQGALIAATQQALQEALDAMGAREELPSPVGRAL